jgi:hypothetical protein
LAFLLAFCSEILLWTNPPTRSLLDWALLALGYVALSGLLLEIAARFRLRDAFGLLTLAGVYGMFNGLMLDPRWALTDVPRTLVSRAMGGQALAGLIALGLFLALAGNGLRSRRSLIVALVLAGIVGVGWGVWAHWSPPEFAGLDESAPGTLLLYGGIGIGLIALALLNLRRSESTPPDLRLGLRGWVFTLVVLGVLTIIHLLQGEIDSVSLSVVVTLSTLSIMIIWFQKHKKGTTLLDEVTNQPLPLLSLVLLVIVFGLASMVGYVLPRGAATSEPLAVISALFTAYGLIWLPAVTIVLGAQAFSRQARAMRL